MIPIFDVKRLRILALMVAIAVAILVVSGCLLGRWWR